MNIIYLAPSPNPLNGISQYATLFLKAASKYLTEMSFRRTNEVEFEQIFPNLPSNSIVMAEMGAGDGKICQALGKQKQQRPDLKRLIVVHDPPRFAVEATTFLEKMSFSLPTRFLRRLFLDYFGWLVERRIFLPTDTFLCLTSIGRDILQEKIRRFFPFANKVFYVPHLLYLDPPDSVIEPESPEPRLGMFGYVSPHKGLDVIVKAAHWLRKHNQPIPDIQIYGQPINYKGKAYFDRVRQMTSDFGLENVIRFMGYLPEESIATFLRSLDALAIPYQEFGLVSASGVLQWARSVGIPVIANDTRALSSLIADGVEGRVISTRDVQSWAQAIRSVAIERHVWKSFRSNIIVRRSDAEWKPVTNAIAEILRNL